MRRLIAKNRGVVSIAVVIGILIGVAVLGFGGNKILKFSQASSLVRQADELKINEKYEEAIKLLEKAQDKAFTQSLKERISKGLEENKQLIPNRDIYYQGVEKDNKGDLKGAIELWDKIPEDSIYFKRAQMEVDIPVNKPSGEQVHLINYNHAKDPTWKELIAFLEKDGTDDNLFIKNSFVCSNFAEMLHNNAEKAGIRAAFVLIELTAPHSHALNAFNTIDKGLVYIDDTGKGFTEIRKEYLDRTCEFDKVEYIVEGKEEGSISIDVPSVSPEYQFYEHYTQTTKNLGDKMDKYNLTMDEFNKKTVIYTKKVEDYEKKVEDYNNGITIYNEETDKIKNLNEKYDKGEITWEYYNQEWNRLDEEIGKLRAREDFNTKQIALDKEKRGLDYELDLLNKEKQNLDNERYSLRKQEETLGTCIWKSLGKVTKIKVYW